VQAGPTVVADGSEQRFDHVVVTAAPPVAKHLVKGLEPAEQERLEAIRYQGIVCASVLTIQPLAGYYLTYLYDEAPFTAVVEMSAFVDPGQFGGRTLIYLPKYCSPDDSLFEETDEALAESFLPALEKVYPMFSRSDVEAFQVSRVRNVFPISTLGYSNGVPGFDTSIPGVHLVSSAQIVNGTLNVNDTIALAERASLHLVALDEAGVR
jgi:protoporphyrinogen oxidase